MDIDQLVPTNSKFLTKEDVGEQGRNLTIARFDYAEVNSDNGQTESKAVILWREQDFKPMVLNKENATRLKAIFKTSDTDQMIGKTVNVYNDIFVQFAGKQTGGVRIRPPQGQRPQQRPAQQPPQNADWQPTPPTEAYEGDSDIPF